MATKLEKLEAKRLKLELEIKQAQAEEARKSRVLELAEAAGILLLSDEILIAAFAKIKSENQ